MPDRTAGLDPLVSAPDRISEPGDYLRLLQTANTPDSWNGGAGAGRPPRAGRSLDIELRELGVGELLRRFRSGDVTPTALLAALRRAWADAPEGSGILCEIAGAGEAAEAANRAWAEGRARPLEGVPFAVKDIIDVEGAQVTCGSISTGDRIAGRDATAVARLRAAGAIPVLMVATTEFASGAVMNRRYGPARNPWDRRRWTGGSSAGSGAVLAARLVPLALGTDTGGSIRVPAAMCGVTGLKPTYGLVPRTGVASLSWTLDHVGPMARSAADLRLVLPHLMGGDGEDPTAPPVEVVAGVRRQLESDAPTERALRVGVPAQWFTLGHPGVLQCWEAVLDALRASGAEVTRVELPDPGAMDDSFMRIVVAEMLAAHEGRLDRLDEYDERVRGMFEAGAAVAAVDYLRALRRRPLNLRAALAAMEEVDVLIVPGTPVPAQPLEATEAEVEGQRIPVLQLARRNTSPGNVLGLPVAAAPAGFVDGLPVGVQIMGKPWADATCLAVAEQLQALTGHHLEGPFDPSDVNSI